MKASLCFLYAVMCIPVWADLPANVDKPNTLPGGNGTIEWDIAAVPSPIIPDRWYVAVITYINRPPDSQHLRSLISSTSGSFYVLRSRADVDTFNGAMGDASRAPYLVALPDMHLLGFCLGHLEFQDGKVSFESEDFLIRQPLSVYDRWAAQARQAKIVGVKKRIPGDLSVNFDVDASGDTGLSFLAGRLDSEAVEQLRNCQRMLTSVAESRLLPRIRALSQSDQKAQQSAIENQKKADLLK